MSLEYADQRVAEALKQTGGNHVKARQLLITWAMSDTKLLQSLTRHHLKGIVAYHIDRVASGRANKPASAPSKKPQTVSAARDDAFGKEILKAVASSSSAIFGLEGYSSPQGRTQASKQHVDAIRQMAERSKHKN